MLHFGALYGKNGIKTSEFRDLLLEGAIFFFIFKSSLFTSSHMSKTVYKIVQPERANKYINTHTGDVVYDFVYILDSKEYCFSK